MTVIVTDDDDLIENADGTFRVRPEAEILGEGDFTEAVLAALDIPWNELLDSAPQSAVEDRYFDFHPIDPIEDAEKQVSSALNFLDSGDIEGALVVAERSFPDLVARVRLGLKRAGVNGASK